MFSGGMFPSMPGMREALSKPEPPLEWLEATLERSERRMHSTDTASLQAEVDQLRLYIAVLFQLLITRGVFTVEEAQRRVAELQLQADQGGAARRDVVSGAELIPKENPFRGLATTDGRPKGWRAWVRFGVAAACVLGSIAFGAGLAWYINWVGKP